MKFISFEPSWMHLNDAFIAAMIEAGGPFIGDDEDLDASLYDFELSYMGM